MEANQTNLQIKIILTMNFQSTESMQIRSNVLEVSLLFEALTSAFLAALLDIDAKSSKTMGNTSKALSFDAKVQLLTDMKSMGKEEASKFQDFMEIRNQFMHNAQSQSYVLCFDQCLSGKGSKLLKNYPQNDSLELEAKYKECFNDLSSEILGILLKLVDKIKEKFSDKATNDLNRKVVELFHEGIDQVTSNFSDVGIHIKQKIYQHILNHLPDEEETSLNEVYPRILGQKDGKNIVIGKNERCFYVKYEDATTEKSTMLPESFDPNKLTLEQGLEILNL